VFEIVVSLLYQNAPRYENRTRLSWEHPNPLRHLLYFSSRDAINLFVWASTSPLTAAILALGFASGVAPFLLLLHSFSTCTCYLGIHYGPLPPYAPFCTHAPSHALPSLPPSRPPPTPLTRAHVFVRSPTLPVYVSSSDPPFSLILHSCSLLVHILATPFSLCAAIAFSAC
jgi:hypothetical protein